MIRNKPKSPEKLDYEPLLKNESETKIRTL